MRAEAVVVTGMRDALKYVREEVNKEIRVHQLLLFLVVCDAPGITMTEVGEILAMPQGSVSRNVNLLAHKYGIISIIPDRMEQRRLAMVLTGRGEKVRDTMVQCFKIKIA